MTYTWFACEFTTGSVITELPLTKWSAQRHMAGGQAGGSLVLGDQDSVVRRREVIKATDPMRCTLALDLDGRLIGEWLIWKQAIPSGNDPITLSGQEVISYLSSRLIPANTFKGREQLAIAQWMIRAGFRDPAGPVSIVIPAVVPSGQRRDRTYKAQEAPISQRLSELSEVLNGFEYVIDSEWDWSSGFQKIKRTLRLGYPKVGSDLGLTFQESVLKLGYDRDGTKLGSEAFAIGAGDDAGQMIGEASSTNLTDQGYPALQVVKSYTSVTEQDTLDQYAAALLAQSQSDEVPPSVMIKFDIFPKLGDFGLGDVVRIKRDPERNFPDGYDEEVRILGWTITPGPPVMPLEVTTEGVE